MSDTTTGTEQTLTGNAAYAAEESRIWEEIAANDAAGADAGRDPDAGTGNDTLTTETTEASDSGDGGQAPHAADGGALDAQPGNGADGQAAAKTQATDPWAKAPAEYRKLYDETVAEWRKRVAGQDRKIGQLNARLLATGAPAKAGSTGGAGTAAKPANLADDPDLKKLTEDFPEVAAPIRKVLEASQANVHAVQQQLSAMQAGEREGILSDNEAAVLDRHSDFVTVASSPEFKAWTDGLSPSLKAILAENARRIVDPMGAIAIVDLFKAQHAGTAGARPGAVTAQAGGGTGNLSGKRARQQESSVAGHHGGGPRVTTDPPGEMTAEQAWEHYERQEAAQKRRA